LLPEPELINIRACNRSDYRFIAEPNQLAFERENRGPQGANLQGDSDYYNELELAAELPVLVAILFSYIDLVARKTYRHSV